MLWEDISIENPSAVICESYLPGPQMPGTGGTLIGIGATCRRSDLPSTLRGFSVCVRTSLAPPQ